MKKNRFTEFFKGKGYYVLLFVGVLAIAAVALIGSRLSSGQSGEDQNYVDLNGTDNNIAAQEGDTSTQVAQNNQASGQVANNEQGGSSSTDVATNDNPNTSGQYAQNDQQVEYEGYSDEAGTQSAQNPASTTTAQAAEQPAVEASGSTVKSATVPAMQNLSFKTEDGLMWPVKGNVIMNYSMDHTVYYATLMQYKCNPAIIIDAEVGADVKAAADGVVSSIDPNNEETGYTVTMDIGNGYSLVYGQLDKDTVKLKVGKGVNAGDVIGKIAQPTKYYTVEGSNLYFKVLQNDQSVNPMLLLR